MWLFALCVALAVYFYLKVSKVNSYWNEKGISYIKSWPIVGNMAPVAFRKLALVDLIGNFYKKYKDQRYVGFYQFSQPTLLINDIELIKEITVKQFDSFPDHNIFSANTGDSNPDDISAKNLFSLTVKQGWHDMRSTLSPSFTSSKMRTMFLLMVQCADQFSKHFQKQGDSITIEMKDAFTRFTNDVIGTAAFGVTCDSLEDPENEFYLMGKELTDFSGIKSLKLFGYVISPTLMKLFHIKMFNQKVTTFFQNLIKESLRVREEKQIVRPDMIHLLMEARKGRRNDQKDVIDTGFAVVQESELGNTQKTQKTEITDDDITAQALIFFLAGFDTASILMSYTAYELALNPEIQKKLQEEVDVTLKECKGKITYEALLGMKYLDNVISETLRKWTPGAILDRKSVKPFTIQPERPGEKPLHLDAGIVCWIPTLAIHKDPQYYPDPEKFDPERFSDVNKHKIKPFTYFPFGSGPRNCIGSRFALLESKLIILKILETFSIVPVEKTSIPIQFSKKTFNIVPEDGYWLGLRSREAYSL